MPRALLRLVSEPSPAFAAIDADLDNATAATAAPADSIRGPLAPVANFIMGFVGDLINDGDTGRGLHSLTSQLN